MPLIDRAHYVDFGDGATTGYFSVAKRPQNTAVAAGVLRRQFTAPSVGNERVFVCIVAGTTANTTDATWTLTRGAKSTDGTATWQECTGLAALNGDLTNTPNWNDVKNTAITLGQVIQSNDGTKILICSTAGTAGNGSEPSWAATGSTTADNTATWTTIGASFSSWAAPHARLTNCLTTNWAQAGNKVYIASEHAETSSANITINGAGTSASPIEVYCVDKLNVPPSSANLTTGATISTTAGGDITIVNGANVLVINGMTFSAGDGSNQARIQVASGTGAVASFKNCRLRLNNTSATSVISLSLGTGNPTRVSLDNTTFKFGSTSQTVAPRGLVSISRMPALEAGSSVPTTLFTNTNSPRWFDVFVTDSDFSDFGAGCTLVGDFSGGGGIFNFQRCKLGASVAVAAAQSVLNGATVYLDQCDSGGTIYRTEKYSSTGSDVTETTIVRTGGASDGTTSHARKIVSGSLASFLFPYTMLAMAQWNDTTGADVTVDIYGVWGGGAVPNNDEVWAEVEYPGSPSSPLGTVKSTAKADPLATAAAGASADGSTWGGSTTPFKISVTLTAPQVALRGDIIVRIKVGKPSATVYIDDRLSVH